MALNKIILGVFGAGRRGKSETLLLLIDILTNDKTYSEIDTRQSHYSENDKVAIFGKNGFRVGITTMGDYPEAVKNECMKLIENQCDFIVTATRTKGGTTKEANRVAKQYGYDAIWFEKNRAVNGWCKEWPATNENEKFKLNKKSYFNKINKLDALFLFEYIDSLIQG
ncbi:TPA: hypothetical protein ACXJEZ_002691 [Providencia rettgeri]